MLEISDAAAVYKSFPQLCDLLLTIAHLISLLYVRCRVRVGAEAEPEGRGTNLEGATNLMFLRLFFNP